MGVQFFVDKEQNNAMGGLNENIRREKEEEGELWSDQFIEL